MGATGVFVTARAIVRARARADARARARRRAVDDRGGFARARASASSPAASPRARDDKPTAHGWDASRGSLMVTTLHEQSPDPPCRWVRNAAPRRAGARATAHGDDDDRHERGAHPRCGAKIRDSPSEATNVGRRARCGGADDARWRRDGNGARADARSNAMRGGRRASAEVTRDIFVRLFAQVLVEERGRRVQVRERDARDGDGEQSFETTDGWRARPAAHQNGR